MWAVWTRDQTACSVQADLDLKCLQKLLVLSIVGKELIPFLPEHDSYIHETLYLDIC